MKQTTLIVGILLIVLGVATLGYEGFTLTTKEKVVDVGTEDAGSIEVATNKKTTIPLRPIMGGLALVAGVILVIVSNKKP